MVSGRLRSWPIWSVMLRYFAELARYRDLLFWLAAKDIKVRYKLPILGFVWALLVPLLSSGILWLIFTYVVPTSVGRYPFFLFLIAGMFPWNFFSQSVSQATMSVLDAGALIKKTAFPRAVLPLAIVAANLVNFLLAMGVVLGIIVLSRIPMGWHVGILPLAIGLHALFTTGVVLLVAGLQVRYRDIKYLTEVGLLLWFYFTPIFYPLDFVKRAPGFLQALYRLNPLVPIMELYRLALLGPDSHLAVASVPQLLATTMSISIVIFLLGLSVFRRHEPAFADWVMG